MSLPAKERLSRRRDRDMEGLRQRIENHKWIIVKPETINEKVMRIKESANNCAIDNVLTELDKTIAEIEKLKIKLQREALQDEELHGNILIGVWIGKTIDHILKSLDSRRS